jgi:hypothetical protein
MSELAIVLRYVRNAQQYFVRRTGRRRVDLAGDPRLGRSTPTKADRLITRIQSALKVNEENIDLTTASVAVLLHRVLFQLRVQVNAATCDIQLAGPCRKTVLLDGDLVATGRDADKGRCVTDEPAIDLDICSGR